MIGHLYENGEELRQEPIYSLIYTFHMPFFMVLSGWVTHYSLKVPVTKHNIYFYIWKKFRSLILPPTMWTLAFHFFFSQTWQDISIGEIWNGVSSGYWYLPCLFMLYLYLFIALIISNCTKLNKIVSLIVLCLAVIGGVLVKDEMFRTSMSYSIFFIIGYLLGANESVRAFASNQYLFGICLLIFCLIAGFYSKIGQDDITNKIIRMLTGIVAIPIMLRVGQMITERHIRMALAYIGRHTLAIYMLHFAFRNNYPFVYLSQCNGLVQFVILFAYAIIICYMCIFIERLFDNSIITKYLFFGKSK